MRNQFYRDQRLFWMVDVSISRQFYADRRFQILPN